MLQIAARRKSGFVVAPRFKSRPSTSHAPNTNTKPPANVNALKTLVVPYQSQLTYLSQHQNALLALQDGVSRSAKQWQHWFYVCLGGMVLFIPTIWLARGRWSPGRAKKDEQQHEADVERELQELVSAGAGTAATTSSSA